MIARCFILPPASNRNELVVYVTAYLTVKGCDQQMVHKRPVVKWPTVNVFTCYLFVYHKKFYWMENSVAEHRYKPRLIKSRFIVNVVFWNIVELTCSPKYLFCW